MLVAKAVLKSSKNSWAVARTPASISADDNALGDAAVADELDEVVGVPAFVAFVDAAGTTRIGEFVDAVSTGT